MIVLYTNISQLGRNPSTNPSLKRKTGPKAAPGKPLRPIKRIKQEPVESNSDESIIDLTSDGELSTKLKARKVKAAVSIKPRAIAKRMVTPACESILSSHIAAVDDHSTASASPTPGRASESAPGSPQAIPSDDSAAPANAKASIPRAERGTSMIITDTGSIPRVAPITPSDPSALAHPGASATGEVTPAAVTAEEQITGPGSSSHRPRGRRNVV